MDSCDRCGEGPVIVDPSTNFRVCTSCGVEHSADLFETQAFDSEGRLTGSLIRTSDVSAYRETKIYRAKELISDITSRLGLSTARAADVLQMATDVTEGEFGAGIWFSVLVAACSYIVMRQNRLPLAIAEAAALVDCDVHEIGRMVGRVVDHLELGSLPEFDIVESLERAVRTCPCLEGIEKEKKEEMLKQGRFLLHCSMKWFLTTGRQPLPIVAAVLALVSDFNGVSVDVEDVAKETYAGITTSKLRKKELMETLVEAAKVLLPWGEDVTVKNLVHNAPLLLRYMEMKSRSESFELGTLRATLQDGSLDSDASDSLYFDPNNMKGTLESNLEEMETLKLSAECLSDAYKKAIEGCKIAKSLEEFKNRRGRRRGGIVIEALMGDGWGRKPSFEQIIEKNVGYDPLPPSFTAGVEARKRRREKIDAAKIRIMKIMKPKYASILGVKKDSSPLMKHGGKRRKSGIAGGIDWEDCIVELLLLHQVNEEEIEQGQYKRLLDLHIFNSLST